MEPPAKRRRRGKSPLATADDDDDDDELCFEPVEVSAKRDPGYKLSLQRAYADRRFQATMAHIFGKYGRDFDGIGDEIDMVSGEIVVDNGHLQNMRDEGDVGACGQERDVDQGVLLGHPMDDEDERHWSPCTAETLETRARNDKQDDDIMFGHKTVQQSQLVPVAWPQSPSRSFPSPGLLGGLCGAPFAFGASPLAFGASPLAFGASPLAFGASPLAFGAPPLAFGASPLAFGVSPAGLPWSLANGLSGSAWEPPSISPRAPRLLPSPGERYNFPAQDCGNSIWAPNYRFKEDDEDVLPAQLEFGSMRPRPKTRTRPMKSISPSVAPTVAAHEEIDLLTGKSSSQHQLPEVDATMSGHDDMDDISTFQATPTGRRAAKGEKSSNTPARATPKTITKEARPGLSGTSASKKRKKKDSLQARSASVEAQSKLQPPDEKSAALTETRGGRGAETDGASRQDEQQRSRERMRSPARKQRLARQRFSVEIAPIDPWRRDEYEEVDDVVEEISDSADEALELAGGFPQTNYKDKDTTEPERLDEALSVPGKETVSQNGTAAADDARARAPERRRKPLDKPHKAISLAFCLSDDEMPIWSKPKQSATLGRLATQPMPPGLPGIKETPTGPSSTGDSTEDAGALNDTGSPILPLASGQSGKRRRPRKSRAASGRDEPLPPPLAAQPMPPGLPDLGIKETPTGPSSTEDSTEDAGALDEAGSPSLPLASGQSRKRRRPMLPLAAQPMPPGLPDSGIKETPTGPSPTGDAGALNDAGSPSLPLASGQSGQRRRPRKSRTASGRDEPMPPPPPPLAVQQPSSSVARHDSSAPAAPVEDKSRRLTKELRWLRKLNGPAMDMILAQTSPTADGPAHPRPPRRAASGPRPGVEGPGSVSQLQDGAGHDETPSEAAAEVGAPADQVTDAPPSPPAPRPGVEELESVSQLQDGAGHDEAPSEAGHEETPSEAAAEVGAPADQVTDAPPSPPAPRPGVEELESVRQLQDGAGHEETPSKAAAEVGAPADQVTDAPPSPPAPRPGVKELESVSQLQDGAGHDEAPSEAAAEVGALPANQVTDAPPSPPAPRPGVEELESVRQLQDGAGHDEAPSEAAAEVGASPDQVTDAPPSPPAPSTQQHPPVASPAKPARRTAPASKPQTPRHASRAIKVPSSRRSILSLVSFADDDADEGDIDELGRSLAGATPSAPFVSSGASRKIWKSSARTTEIYHTPVKRRATDVLSPGSIIKTPGGTLRACGIAGFRCGRDFCFTCL